MGRVRELDALRGIMSLLILTYHCTRSDLFAGWSRVDFFFVLSGYLTTSRILAAGGGTLPWRRFYARRLLRLLPPYYLLIVLLAACDGRRGEPEHVAGLLYALSFTQNSPHYWWGSVPQYFPEHLGHTWYLAIEAQFLLVWPVLVSLVQRRTLAVISGALVVDSAIARAAGLHPWTLLARCDGLALGALVALDLSRRSRERRAVSWAGPALAWGIAVSYLSWYLARPGHSPRSFNNPLGWEASLAISATNVAYAGLVGLVACNAGAPLLGPLRRAWLCYLGTISYGIYLFSFTSISLVALAARIPRGSWGAWPALASMVVTLAVAMASWELLERPLLDLGGRWDRPRA